MKIFRLLITPIVRMAYLVNSISAKIFTFVLVKLLGREEQIESKKVKKRFK